MVFKRDINNLRPSIYKNQNEENIFRKEEKQRMKHKTNADEKGKTIAKNVQICDQILRKIPKVNALILAI